LKFRGITQNPITHESTKKWNGIQVDLCSLTDS